MDEFHLLRPWALALVPLSWLLLAWLSRYANARDAWTQVCDPRLLQAMRMAPPPQTGAGRWLPTLHRGRARWLPTLFRGRARWLLALGSLVLGVALAGPALEREALPASRISLARIVVLDLSRSMLVDDVVPNRFTQARFKVADLLRASRDRQVALVAFAGDAHLVTPLTDDIETLMNLLPALEPDVMPVEGSRVDVALAQARRALLSGGATAGDVIVVGDDGGDDKALDAAAQLRSAGFRVSALGIGTASGAPVPARNGGFASDVDGNIVTAGLDARGLGELAERGGGRYAELDPAGADVTSLLRDYPDLAPSRWRRLLGDGSGGDDERTLDRWRDEGPWLVLALLPLAALAFRRGWLMAVAPVLGLSVGLSLTSPRPAVAQPLETPASSVWDRTRQVARDRWLDLWQRPDQQAAAAIERGDAGAAGAGRASARWRGAGHYRDGAYEDAARAFRDAADSRVDPASAYNLGNALAREGKLDEAIAAYDESLGTRPGFEDAEFNKALIERLKQQHEQQQSSQGDGEQQDSQDGDAGNPSSGGAAPQDQNDGQPQQQDTAGEQAGQQDSDASDSSDSAQPSSADGDEPSPDGEPEQSAANDEREAQGNRSDEVAEQQAQARAAEAGDGDSDDAGDRALDAWLRRIPDDPGGLLRRKFSREARRSGTEGTAQTW